MSNGGGMVLEAAKRMPDRFAGIAPFMAWDGYEPTPVPDLSGTGLTRVVFGYAPGDPGMPKNYVEVLSQLPGRWGRALGMNDV
jgi:poly(3-hydroxybutyrate) depolymerase